MLSHLFTFFAALIAIASGLVLSACATPPSKEGTHPELKGVWLVEDVDQRGVIDRARLAVVFGDRGQISGQAGCNRFAGTLSLEGGTIKVGPLGVHLKFERKDVWDMMWYAVPYRARLVGRLCAS